MSTIGRDLFLQTLRAGGRYLGDPIPHSLWTYVRLPTKNLCFKVCHRDVDEDAFLDSPNVSIPKLCWSREGGITRAGEELLLSR